MDTISVVLPCAFEGGYAEKTVDALWNHTNWRLKEVLVVDDGSTPPLSSALPARLKGDPRVRLLRHNKTLGLIASKKTGGDAAVSDIIVFFDCHVSPRDGWEEAFIKQMRRGGDHRTVVVPTITSLDPDTWQEDAGAHSKACYVLWNGDFTWLGNPGRDVPLMSGGLLALTRRWWYETGGYDEHMVAWGGENIDQSLRIWLCGGRIEVAEGAYVAHMWRVASNPKTRLKYPMPTEDVMRNKGRAVKAWFSEFAEKSFTFPEYRQFESGEHHLGTFENFDRLKKQQGCAPFSSYIQRFSYVYLDGGLIPPEVFQLREESTGLCLERLPRDEPPHAVIMAPCAARVEDGHAQANRACSGCVSTGTNGISELQLWHAGNRDKTKAGAPCCSGLHNWNFLQCLMATGPGQPVQTFECDISGSNDAQAFSLDASSGKLQYRRGEDCVVPRFLRGPPGLGLRGAAEPGPASICTLQATPAIGEAARAGERAEGTQPMQFKKGSLCLTAARDDTVTVLDNSAWTVRTAECDDGDPKQVFHAGQTEMGLVMRVAGGQCLDAAGGSRLLVYPCYDGQVENPNQVWQIKDERLLWDSSASRCVDVDGTGKGVTMKEVPAQFKLKACTPKAGQRMKRHDIRPDGSFQLMDADSGQCLTGDHTQPGGPLEVRLLMRKCRDNMRWQELSDRHQVSFLPLGYCIDAGNGGVPILYPCHQPTAGRKQMFRVVDDIGAVQLDGGWEDNGRQRFFPQCIDNAPVEATQVKLSRCTEAVKSGVRWTRANVMEPIEHKLWAKASKPPPGSPVLGGDAEPP